MASVIFLKHVNMGGHKTFRYSLLASEMAKLGVMNVGALRVQFVAADETGHPIKGG